LVVPVLIASISTCVLWKSSVTYWLIHW